MQPFLAPTYIWEMTASKLQLKIWLGLMLRNNVKMKKATLLAWKMSGHGPMLSCWLWISKVLFGLDWTSSRYNSVATIWHYCKARTRENYHLKKFLIILKSDVIFLWKTILLLMITFLLYINRTVDDHVVLRMTTAGYSVWQSNMF